MKTQFLAGFLAVLPLCGFLPVDQAYAEKVQFRTFAPAVAGGDVAVTGVFAKPAGPGPFPAVVLLHTCGGLRGHVAIDWPEFLTRHGYAALSVDSFGSRGLEPCPNGLSPPAPGTKVFASRVMISDAHGALAWLENRPDVEKGRTAIMGFSLGGMAIHFALLRSYARSVPPRAFVAAISLYGPCAAGGGRVAMPKLGHAPLPMLDIIGDRDERILRECRELLPNGPSAQLRVLHGAYHNFDNPEVTAVRYSSGGSPMRFSAEATEAARELVRVFLGQHLRRAPSSGK